MKKYDRAADIFVEGFNCSQSVLSTYAEELGLDKSNAFKIATGFGGGIAHSGETCGAVTGAFMALGLKYGSGADLPDETAKKLTMEKIKIFTEKFIDLHGSIRCKDLLGYDITDPADSEYVRENKLTKEICPKYIKTAGKLLEELL